MGPSPHRVMLGMLALSLTLHALPLVLTGALRVPESGARRAFELVSVDLSPSESPPPATAASVTPPPLGPAPPRRAATRPATRPPTAPPTTPPVPLPASDVPRSSPPEEEPRLPRDALVLLPRVGLAFSLDAGVTTPTLGLGRTATGDLVAGLARETLGRGRVDRGLVHPYYRDLGKALIKNWDADRVAAAGLKGFAEQMGKNLKQFNDIWLERAAAFGQSGSPLAGDAVPRGPGRRAPVSDQIKGISGIDLDARKELGRAMAEQFRATRRATIRVVQDAGGRLVGVELVEPSNDQTVDREALVDVKTAAEKLPPPPAEALAGRSQLSSLWSFELIVSISPPVPTFTFEFDEALGFIDARLPLDRRIYKKVRLVSVE